MIRIPKISGHEFTHEDFHVVHVNGDGIIYRNMSKNLEIYSPELKLIRTISTRGDINCLCDDPKLIYSSAFLSVHTEHHLFPIMQVFSLVYHPYLDTHIALTPRHLYEIEADTKSITRIADISDAHLPTPVSSSYSPNLYLAILRPVPSLQIVNVRNSVKTHSVSLALDADFHDYPDLTYRSQFIPTPATADGLTILLPHTVDHLDMWHANKIRSTIYRVDKSGDRAIVCMTYMAPHTAAIVHASEIDSAIHLCDIRCRESRDVQVSDTDSVVRPLWHAAPNGVDTLYAKTSRALLRFI